MEAHGRESLHAELAANLTWVRRFAVAIVRDDALADDVTQDVMHAALQRGPAGRSGGLRAWLATLTRRSAIDRARSESARRAREQSVARPESDGGSAAAVARGDRSRRVVEAVMQLSEPCRSAVLLRYLDQLPMPDVARRLGVGEVTARKHVAAGLATLKARLDHEFGEDSRSWALALVGSNMLAVRTATATHAGLIAIVQGVVLMNLKWIVAAVTVVVVALIAWQANAHVEPRLGSSAGAVNSRAELAQLTVPATSEPGRSAAVWLGNTPAAQGTNTPGGAFLVVRSAVGLTLPYAEVQDAAGDWKQAELDHDRCAIDTTIPFPRLVRAPGHVPQSATRVGEELVLEPDALLTLDAVGLRKGTRTIRVDDPFISPGQAIRPETQHACTSGFVSADRWCVAVTPELAASALLDDQSIPIEIVWPDYRRGVVRLKLEHGVRGQWTVPLDRVAAGSPLHVHVERPAGEPVGDVVFTISPYEATTDDRALLYFPWGGVVVEGHSRMWMDEQRLSARSSDYTFDFLPTGVNLSLVAQDRASSAYARTTFVHDGKDITLQLVPGFVLTGHVLAASDRSPVRSMNFIWEFHDEDDTMYEWRFEGFPLLTDAAGRFEARGPKQFLARAEMSFDPPSRLVVQVNAPGFDRLEKHFQTNGVRRFDCGDLLVARRIPQAVVLPDPGLNVAAFSDASLRFSDMPDVRWEGDRATQNSDGSFNLFLEPHRDNPSDTPLFEAFLPGAPHRTGMAWHESKSRWMTVKVIFPDRDETWLFERQPDGRYAAVPRREIDIEMKCAAVPAGARRWMIGWQWQDQWGELCQTAPEVVGETSRIHASMPIGAQFWWSAGEAPPGVLGVPEGIGGSVPLEGSQARVLLR